MAGWHHQLDGHEFGWTPGVGDGQGGLVCCDSWGCKESDTTERLNWTELKRSMIFRNNPLQYEFITSELTNIWNEFLFLQIQFFICISFSYRSTLYFPLLWWVQCYTWHLSQCLLHIIMCSIINVINISWNRKEVKYWCQWMINPKLYLSQWLTGIGQGSLWG